MPLPTPLELDQALARCAGEPIHLLGRIQPQGALLAVDRNSTRRLVQASANLDAFLGCATPALGQPLAAVLGSATAAAEALFDDAGTRHVAHGRLAIDGRQFEARAFAADPLDVLELLPLEADIDAAALLVLQRSLQRLAEIADLTEYFDGIAALTRELTGFDRVMVYRFDANWDGEVIAERRNANADSYLGNRFPASDIPPQARALYLRNPVRLVADVQAEPVALQPADAAPLDLSRALLRSFSPVHVEYLRNMGVQASMSISLRQNGRLWGLIACHHLTPRPLPLALQEAATLIAEIASATLASVEAEERRTLGGEVSAIVGTMLKYIDAGGPDAVLANLEGELLDLLDAGGLIVVVEGAVYRLGHTPQSDEVRELLDWLAQQPAQEVFACDDLPQRFPPAADYPELAAGLLASPLTREMRHAMVWLRPEHLRTVQWAGRPEKTLVADAAGMRLSPRTSFAAWTEAWRGRSAAWSPVEQEAGALLARALTEGLAQKSRLLAIAARQRESEQHHLAALREAAEAAEAANRAKTTFLTNMGHELRTPLNGIMGMTELARRRASEPKQLEQLDVALRLSKQLLTLINDLLDLARIEGDRLKLDLGEFRFAEAIDLFHTTLALKAREKNLTLHVRTAPEVDCRRFYGDVMRLGQLLRNLVDNAIKFTKTGSVTIGSELLDEYPTKQGNEARLRIRVSDTGIGISPAEQARLFRLFEQVDGSEARHYGGTGLGLFLARRLAQLMGGEIGCDSSPGNGSTFWFTVRLGVLGISAAVCEAAPIEATTAVLPAPTFDATTLTGMTTAALPTVALSPAATVDRDVLAATGKTLQALFDTGDLDARAVLAEHAALLQAADPAAARRMAVAIEQFDFDAALAALQTLLARHGE